jgi:hypothetical protein
VAGEVADATQQREHAEIGDDLYAQIDQQHLERQAFAPLDAHGQDADEGRVREVCRRRQQDIVDGLADGSTAGERGLAHRRDRT